MNPIPAPIAYGLADEMVNLAGATIGTSHSYFDNYRDDLSDNHYTKRKYTLQTHLFKGELKVSFHLEENLGTKVVERFNIDDVLSIVIDEDLIVTTKGVTIRLPIEYPEE